LSSALENRGHKRGLDFSAQYPLSFSFIIDLAFPKHKVAIEADGQLWHQKPEHRKRDFYKDMVLERSGWRVLRFSDIQILHHLEECISRIEAEIARYTGSIVSE